jgi:predicted acetyltransferase
VTDLRLRPLRSEDERPARQAHRELGEEGFTFLLGLRAGQPWTDYLDRLEKDRRGIALEAGRVPATFLAAVADGEIVGRVSIRHQLNSFLMAVGGHIGYGVRSQFRRRGFASEMLGQALVIARALDIDRVLITCDEDNVASARIIERHGGQLEDVRRGPEGPPKRRYWIG